MLVWECFPSLFNTALPITYHLIYEIVFVNCKPLFLFIRLSERDRISAVLDDPTFQADPLSATHEYVQNKQPVVEEQPKKKVNKNGSKKKKSKASTGLQSMEM